MMRRSNIPETHTPASLLAEHGFTLEQTIADVRFAGKRVNDLCGEQGKLAAFKRREYNRFIKFSCEVITLLKEHDE